MLGLELLGAIDVSLVGRHGGGAGGGRGAGGGGGHPMPGQRGGSHGGWRGGPGWYGGPFWYGPEVVYTDAIDWDEVIEQPSVEDLADAIAKRIKKKKKENHAVGVDVIGDDSWLSIHTRTDYANAVNQLKASAENLNLTAAKEPGWQPLYQNALHLYDKYHDVGFWSAINPFGDRALGDAAWKAIADTQRRVDEFAAKLRSEHKSVVEPEHKPIDDRLLAGAPELSSLGKYIPWLVGGAVAVVMLPAVIPLLATRVPR